jgi:DedD protein
MVSRSDAPDLAVDELKRRARRRLVGAIVLALAAAVLLPLLLENEPKPLGDEVSIQIPPVDTSKFVNPLSPGKGVVKAGIEDSAKARAATAESATPSAAAPTVPPAPSVEEKRIESQSTAPASALPGSPAVPPAAIPPSGAPAEGTESKKETPPEPKASANQSDAASAKQNDAASMKQSDGVPAASGFVVQVAAFTDRYGAQAQVRKLKRAGFPAYVESVSNGNRELQRVRVGPYPSRDAADAARANLKAAGYDAIVARAR